MDKVNILPVEALEVMGNDKRGGYHTLINMTLMIQELGHTWFTAKHATSKGSSVKEPSHNHPDS